MHAKARSTGRKNKGKKKRDEKIKMGHGGTLDPLASGVLVVGTGRGTKELGSFLGCSKEYQAVALFGCSTDTYDSEGKVVARRPWKHITREKMEETLAQFRGDIMQTPPIYSALKMQGKPLYEYAREGKPLPAEIKARSATVSHFEITGWHSGKKSHSWKAPLEEAAEEIKLTESALRGLRPAAQAVQEQDSTQAEVKSAEIILDGPAAVEPKQESAQEEEERPTKRFKNEEGSAIKPKDSSESVIREAPEDSESVIREAPEEDPMLAVSLSMTVSGGTYVRSLIHDLGLALGSAAHMVALVRTRVGEHKLEEAIEWSDFEQGSSVWENKLKCKLDFGSSGR